ncbi:hypothetical protein C8F01DRAFT_1161160 [Mycena amicta]|nr:hypothetical protein C8F01DRAFT_1161160 [Mycena amicta]
MGTPTMDETYGALYIGVLFATFFQGLLTVQAYTYYTNFPGDSRWLKALVATVWILDTTHLVLVAQASYHYLVTSWGDPAALLVAIPTLNLHMLFVSVPALLCNIFFLYRVWVFSNHNWLIIGFLGCGCLAGFCIEAGIIIEILSIPLVAEYSQQTTNAKWEFSVLAIFDLLLACTLVWYIRTTKLELADEMDGVPARTNLVLRRVMQYAVATGLVTSIVALGTLAAFMLAPDTFIFIAIYFSFGRMHTNALLVNLNARRSLRQSIQKPSSTMGLGSSWLRPSSAPQINLARHPHMAERGISEYPLNIASLHLTVESESQNAWTESNLSRMEKVWSRNTV